MVVTIPKFGSIIGLLEFDYTEGVWRKRGGLAGLDFNGLCLLVVDGASELLTLDGGRQGDALDRDVQGGRQGVDEFQIALARLRVAHNTGTHTMR